MGEASTENKSIAHAIARAFGGTPSVQRFWDDDHTVFTDILSCDGRPTKGVNSYGTIGLSDHSMLQDGQEFPIRVELLGCCASVTQGFPNILASAASFISENNWLCCPGAILQNVINLNESVSETMVHLLFVPPFLWENNFQTVEFETKKVAWLLAVPISEGERVFSESEGYNALEDIFEDRQIDIFDIERPSVA